MASSDQSKALRGEFESAARALFDHTGNGLEIYHLVHKVVHKPKQSSSASTPATPEKESNTPVKLASIDKNAFDKIASVENPKTPVKHASPGRKKSANKSEKTNQMSASLLFTPPKPNEKKSPFYQATPPGNTTPEEDPMKALLDKHFPSKSNTPSNFDTPSKVPSSLMEKLASTTNTPTPEKSSTSKPSKKRQLDSLLNESTANKSFKFIFDDTPTKMKKKDHKK